MATLPLLIGGSIFGNLLSGIMGNNAAHTAADQQAAAGQQAIDFQKSIFDQQQKNQQPYLDAGSTSIGHLMQLIGSGKFGADSTGTVPEYNGHFTAPTLEEARNSPGYQFTAQQGSKGVLQGSAAAGGAISGGTLKALDSFNTGLADQTYGNVFNRSLSTYQTGLQDYQAKLAGYGAKLAGQQQEFGQEFAPAQLGENATQNLNTQGGQVATNVGNLMTQVGNAQAAGTVGGANAIGGAVSGGLNGLTQSLLFSKLLNSKLLQPAGTGPG